MPARMLPCHCLGHLGGFRTATYTCACACCQSVCVQPLVFRLRDRAFFGRFFSGRGWKSWHEDNACTFFYERCSFSFIHSRQIFPHKGASLSKSILDRSKFFNLLYLPFSFSSTCTCTANFEYEEDDTFQRWLFQKEIPFGKRKVEYWKFLRLIF